MYPQNVGDYLDAIRAEIVVRIFGSALSISRERQHLKDLSKAEAEWKREREIVKRYNR